MIDRPATTILTCCHQSSITCTCRYDPGRAEKEECLRLDDIKELLGLELLGVIPESKCILTATNIGQPVICMQDEEAGQGACVRACIGHWDWLSFWSCPQSVRAEHGRAQSIIHQP